MAEKTISEEIMETINGLPIEDQRQLIHSLVKRHNLHYDHEFQGLNGELKRQRGMLAERTSKESARIHAPYASRPSWS